MTDVVDRSLVAVPYPIPAGRGRWRLTLHRRTFDTTVGTTTSQQTMTAELVDARSRRLEQQLNGPSTFTFTINGTSSQVDTIVELATDLYAWRWDEQTGRDICMFRGVIDHTLDQVTEQSYTINVTAHDYLAMLARRMLLEVDYTQYDQDFIVENVYDNSTRFFVGGGNWITGSQTFFNPGIRLPVQVARRNPDGTVRSAMSGRLRDRSYTGGEPYTDFLDKLANVRDGFDYDVSNVANPDIGLLRIFYPRQGVTRNDLMFMYGANVSGFHRTVSSADYANFVRVIGNKGPNDPRTPYADAYNADANNVTVNPVGFWGRAESEPDTSLLATMLEKARGSVDRDGIVVPSYSLNLRPDGYRFGYPNMGDDVEFVARIGRLDVDTWLRVVGISYAISDDDGEDVGLTVGRSPRTLASMLTQSQRDIDALTRR